MKIFLYGAIVLHFISGCRTVQENSLSSSAALQFRCDQISRAPISARRNPIVISYGTNLIVLGGYSIWPGSSDQYKEEYDGAIYDTSTGIWSRLPPPSSGFSPTAGALAGDKIFTMGSKYDSSQKKWMNLAAIYDLTSNLWSQVDLPAEMQEVSGDRVLGYRLNAIASFDNSVFVVGLNEKENKAEWRLFTPSTNSWSPVKNVPVPPHVSHWPVSRYATTVGRSIFLLSDGFGYSYRVDLDKNQWSNPPVIESNEGEFMVDLPGVEAGKDKLILWGGHRTTDRGTRSAVLRNIGYIINTSTLKKEVLPESPFKARSHHGAAKIGSKVIFWGGLVGSESYPDQPREATKDAAVFDVEANTWTCLN
jgi:hypothetical protein